MCFATRLQSNLCPICTPVKEYVRKTRMQQAQQQAQQVPPNSQSAGMMPNGMIPTGVSPWPGLLQLSFVDADAQRLLGCSWDVVAACIRKLILGGFADFRTCLTDHHAPCT